MAQDELHAKVQHTVSLVCLISLQAGGISVWMWRTFALFVDRFLCLTHRTQTNKILYEPSVPVVMLKSARNQWKSSAWRITVLRAWLSRGLIKLQECYPAPTPAEESKGGRQTSAALPPGLAQVERMFGEVKWRGLGELQMRWGMERLSINRTFPRKQALALLANCDHPHTYTHA